MPKNIVICLDGTGNLFKEENSNVIKLFQVSRRCVGEQIAYYDPGVGTLGDPSFKTPVGKRLSLILGAAFGRGLLKNVEEAYAYLMEHHEEGDAIFVFGFSRGAYTARALAAFINRCGLFEKGCQNLIPYAMKLFLEELPRDASDEQRQRYHEVRSTFRRTYGRRFRNSEGKLSWQTPIRFLGLWDTVKSYGWVYDPVRLPRESTNESVQAVRHAVALDEKRVLFPQMHWQRKPATQDVRELWFAGVHSDVGGGYAEARAGLAKISLQWMVNEAVGFGLLVDEDEHRRIVQGFGAGMVRADPGAVQHESLKGPWFIAEALPRRNGDGSMSWWPRRDAQRARPVPGSAVLHGSVFQRMADGRTVDGQPARAPYAPRQLPALTAAQTAQLKAGQPVLLGTPPTSVLLPLGDGSGDVLLHGLSDAERAALAALPPADTRAALHTLATAGCDAMRAALPLATLLGVFNDAVAAQADERARAWLQSLGRPATEAELKAAAAHVTSAFLDARQAVRWLNDSEDPALAAHRQALQAANHAAAVDAAFDALLLAPTVPTAQRSNLAALRALGPARALVLAQALQPNPALTLLDERCQAVSAALDSRAELAEVPVLFAASAPTAALVDKTVTRLTRFQNRRSLLPEHALALRTAGGNVVESLLTAAARLRTG